MFLLYPSFLSKNPIQLPVSMRKKFCNCPCSKSTVIVHMVVRQKLASPKCLYVWVYSNPKTHREIIEHTDHPPSQVLTLGLFQFLGPQRKLDFPILYAQKLGLISCKCPKFDTRLFNYHCEHIYTWIDQQGENKGTIFCYLELGIESREL